MLAQSCRSAKERSLFVVALVVSGLVWLALIVTLVGLLYAPFVALAVVIGHAFFLARVTGHSVRVGSRQLPDLYRRVQSAASRLGLERLPEVYVTSGGGVLNAFATRLFSRNFVILNAEILDACESLDADREPGQPSTVDFIIGHEIGHLALGHLSWNWLLWPARLFPLLGPAYSRACEYSADACGLAVTEDVEASSRALAVLATGGKQAKKVNIEALIEQRHDTGSLVMALVELNSTHPFLSKRVAALHRLRGTAAIGPEVGRNPFSYVMAPFFGFAAGGGAALFTVYLYVAVIGVLAAIAIPNFQKYQERSRAAAFSLTGTELGASGSPSLEELLGQMQHVPQGPVAVLGADEPPQGAGGLGVKGVGIERDADADDHDDEEEDEVPTPRFEARAWLKAQQAAKNKEAVASLATPKALALVDQLYKAGAVTVWVTGVDVDEDGIYANHIVAELPQKAASRKKLVALCTAEYKKQGYAEPCEDGGAKHLWLSWD
jgi:Zn-dependent protease with chaperone function